MKRTVTLAFFRANRDLVFGWAHDGDIVTITDEVGEPRLMSVPTDIHVPEGCRVEPLMSNVCWRGTKCCQVDHNE